MRAGLELVLRHFDSCHSSSLDNLPAPRPPPRHISLCQFPTFPVRRRRRPLSVQVRGVAGGERTLRLRAEDGGALPEPVAVGREGALRDRVQRHSKRGKGIEPIILVTVGL